ncbi:MAG: glycosyl transferase family 39, partial [Anaerolineae bacterium]
MVAILAVALFLRLWRLDFGMELPYLAHTDEPTQYNPAINILKTGDLNPHFFNYPSLTIYL